MAANNDPLASELLWSLSDAIDYVTETATAGDRRRAASAFAEAVLRGAIKPRGCTAATVVIRQEIPREIWLEYDPDELAESSKTDCWRWRGEQWFHIEVERKQVTDLWPPPQPLKRSNNWRWSPKARAFLVGVAMTVHEEGRPRDAVELIRRAAKIALALGLDEADRIDPENSALKDAARQILQSWERRDRD